MTLPLATGDTLQGTAGTASAVTYSIYGDEITAGPTNTYKRVAQGQMAISGSTLYTVPGSTATIVKIIHLVNTTGTAVAVALFNGGSAAGNSIGAFTIPANGQATWTATGGWTIKDANGATLTTSTLTLTGDVTGSGTGSVATTLAMVNTNTGSFGDASHVSQVTLNGKGLATAASSVAIAITSGAVSGLGPLATATNLSGDITTSGSGVTTLPSVNSGVGSFGSATTVPVVTLNAKGQVTAASSTTIAITSSAVTDFVEAAQDAVGSALTDSPSVDFTYNDAGNSITARTLNPLVSRVTAASKTYALADNAQWYERINGGSAMTDTLPTLSAGDNGFTVGVHNKGTTVAETITFTGAGSEVIGDTGTSYVLNYACRQTFIWTGTKWLFGAGNANLPKSPSSAPGAGDFATFTDTAGRQLSSQTLAATKTALGLTGTNSGDQSYTASGDATAPSSATTLVLTLATVNTNVGSFGDASHVMSQTVNAKGLTTAAASVPIAIASTAVSGLGPLATVSNLTGDVTSVGAATTLPTVNANVGTFGDATHVAQVVTNAKGQITGVTSVAIGNNFGVVTGNTGTANSDVTGDTIAITGTGSVSTAATDSPDGLVITNAAATRTAAGNMSAVDYNRVRKEWDAYADFGLVGDLRSVEELPASGTQVVMTSGSNVVNIPNSGATTPFTSTAVDAGKRITIEGAGASGAMLVGFIGAVNTSTQCTVLATVGGSALNASTTVTANATGPVTVHVQWGADNTTAIGTMTTAINAQVYGCPKITFGGNESADWTNAWGIPVPIVFNKTVWLEGIGSWHTTDIGDYTKTGSTRLAWWGTSSDGGTAFGAMIIIAPTGTQALKRPRLSELFLDGRNGNQNQALWLLKWTSCHGASLDNVGFMDALAGAMWTDIATSPTEAADFTRFSFNALCFRQLDDSLLHAPTTTPTTTSSTITLSGTGQTITLASVTGFSAGGGYAWCQSVAGKVCLFQYTGVSGSTLTGCTVAAEDLADPPVLAANLFVAGCTPSKGVAWKASGNASHNTCCGSVRDVQVSFGGTWGPAAIEVGNSDTVDITMAQMNGGSNTTGTNGNRQQRPGVRLNGSNVSGTLAARNWVFQSIDPGGSPGGPLGGISAMGVTNAGALLVAPTGPHYVARMDMGNGAPLPTVELGASLFWNGNGMFIEGGLNSLTANQSLNATVANVVNGCSVVVPPQGWQVGTRLVWDILLSKTAVGTAWTLNVRQHSSLTAGGGTLIATVAFTATAAIDEGGVHVELVCNSLGGSGTALARYRAFHNAGTTAGAAGLFTGGATPAVVPTLSASNQATVSFEGVFTMAAFNTSAPGSGPTFLFLEIVPTTASTVMTVLAPSGVACLKDANP